MKDVMGIWSPHHYSTMPIVDKLGWKWDDVQMFLISGKVVETDKHLFNYSFYKKINIHRWIMYTFQSGRKPTHWLLHWLKITKGAARLQGYNKWTVTSTTVSWMKISRNWTHSYTRQKLPYHYTQWWWQKQLLTVLEPKVELGLAS